MANSSNVRVMIALQEPDLDDEELQETTEKLLQQMRELDEVEKANLVADPNPREGSKSLFGFLPGLLMAEVNAKNIKSLFGFLGDRLGLSEEAAAIEAEVLKPYKEYKQKLQRYEQALAVAMQHENPLTDYNRTELKRYQEILNLTDEDIAPIEEGITSQKESVQSPEQVIGATRDAVKQLEKIGKNSTHSPESRDGNPNPHRPEDPPLKAQPKPNDKRKWLVTSGVGFVLVVSGICLKLQPKFPPCYSTKDLCKIFPQVGNGQEYTWPDE